MLHALAVVPPREVRVRVNDILKLLLGTQKAGKLVTNELLSINLETSGDPKVSPPPLYETL